MIPRGHESAVATREPNMQRAGRNSPFTRGGRAEKCSDEIFYCMGALLTIATYDSATQSQSATLNLRVEVTDSFRDWIRFLLLLLLIYMSKAHPLLSVILGASARQQPTIKRSIYHERIKL